MFKPITALASAMLVASALSAPPTPPNPNTDIHTDGRWLLEVIIETENGFLFLPVALYNNTNTAFYQCHTARDNIIRKMKRNDLKHGFVWCTRISRA